MIVSFFLAMVCVIHRHTGYSVLFTEVNKTAGAGLG